MEIRSISQFTQLAYTIATRMCKVYPVLLESVKNLLSFSFREPIPKKIPLLFQIELMVVKDSFNQLRSSKAIKDSQRTQPDSFAPFGSCFYTCSTFQTYLIMKLFQDSTTMQIFRPVENTTT